ncbi:MAG: VWA domain-containing protein [Acidobacteria bacterium]|nr:MAG: VWA domain-containing protein [Acidobacteriota bacterium]REK02561.1 MAG: VWA domain-containing protein [Acidobacteriota bacterium]REK13636.1 MAG: VWA domain-containing protein [Acidobacteriota bacterium]REK41630.1 MAG: VWA domain-containing protein [Acidobacteriota bacterium]
MAGKGQRPTDPVRTDQQRIGEFLNIQVMAPTKWAKPVTIISLLLGVVTTVSAQQYDQTYPVPLSSEIVVNNEYGRIRISAENEPGSEGSLKAISSRPFERSDISVQSKKGRLTVDVSAGAADSRIDLEITVPQRTSAQLRTRQGEIEVSGNFARVSAETSSGSIITSLPLDNLRYKFIWTAARPRYISEPTLNEPEEKNAGKSVIEGELVGDAGAELVEIETRTSRGILLLNVDPEEMPSTLQERPLTEAAKAMVRSGDVFLSDAIRRASPKFFGDYAATLPPRRLGPELVNAPERRSTSGGNVRTVNVQVLDANNRAIQDIEQRLFTVTEGGFEREIVSVEPTSAPFNLVLLLDVSGSIKNYVDFIRKAARNFVKTVDPQDKVAIITFNDDVKVLSGFSTDFEKLSDSLDSFDSGGGTAYYDSIGYVLAETLEPLKGERVAIVVLTDGEDNRSFLSFNSLIGSLQESGALVYPLYVPAGVIAQGAIEKDETLGSADPLREKFLSLTVSETADDEGERLAQISGGVYYPISRSGELQKAYDDIVKQLRSAYTITYRAGDRRGDGALPRVRVKVDRPGAFVRVAESDRR